MLELLKLHAQLRTAGKPDHYSLVLKHAWDIFAQALSEGQSSSSVAEQVGGSFIGYVKEQINKAGSTWESKEMIEAVLSLFHGEVASNIKLANDKHLGGENFLIYSLTMQSSQRIRSEAKDIL